MFLFSFSAFAQSGIIQGTITDARTNETLAGATVMIQGTTVGAAATVDGTYEIRNVQPGTITLEVRYIGFNVMRRGITIEAGQTLTQNFALIEEQRFLDEVVVTGVAGDSRRRTVGNSVSRIDVTETLDRVSNNTVTELLQSKTPGLTLIPGSGTAGTAANIRLRGAGSITAGNQPVIYVDGIRLGSGGQGNFSAQGQNTSALDAINPADIKSIDVIKGPAAATVYGAEAASGVIVITTRQGSMGEQNTRWNARLEMGQTDWPEDWRPTNYTRTTQAQIDNPALWPGMVGKQVGDLVTLVPLSNDPDALRSGQLRKFTLSADGGGQRYSYFISGSTDTEEGVFLNNFANRQSVRGNFSFMPMDNLNFSVNASYSHNEVRLPLNDNIAYGLIISSWLAVPGRAYGGAAGEGFFTLRPEFANTYDNRTSADRFILSASANYRPVEWFQNRLQVGIDNNSRRATLFYAPDESGLAPFGANVRDGFIAQATPVTQILSVDYGGSMVYNLSEAVRSDFSFGFQFQHTEYQRTAAEGRALGSANTRTVSSAAVTSGNQQFSENKSLGIYVQEQIGLNDRLFFTGAVRMDNNSVFGSEINRVFYPKLSASYVISEESFFDFDAVDQLRLRTAWGQAGNSPGAFDAVRTYSTLVATLDNGSTVPALRYASFGNPDLKPERSSEFEIGFDLNMYRDRLNFEFTYYNSFTTDALLNVSVPPSTGFSGNRLENLGEISNSGFEVLATFIPYDAPNLQFVNTLSFSTNKNELISFGDGRDSQIFGIYAPVQRYEEGKPLGAFWSRRAVVDANDNLVLEDPEYRGPSLPTREIRYSAELNFMENWRLFALFDYAGGHYQFNVKDWRRDRAGLSWEVINPDADPNEVRSRMNATQTYYSVQEADFIKLRDLSLSYRLPARWVNQAGVSNTTLSLTGHNLAVLWTKYGGQDPEVNFHGDADFSRVDSWTAPPMRRISASINVNF